MAKPEIAIPELRTEKAVAELVAAVQHDLEVGAEFIRLGAEVVRYVEKNTSRWLSSTPGRLHAKAMELDLVMKVLQEEPDEVRKEMTSEGRLPPVEVIKMPKAAGA